MATTPAQDRAHAERSRRYHAACAEAARREITSAERMGDPESAAAFREVFEIQREHARRCERARDGG
jgi:hypothetical protein